MGFAAVARVTQTKWVACRVRDHIQFGLVAGGELPLETTFCDQIRDTHHPVIIEHVSQDEAFCHHPTPALYGFQSYISFPIVLKNGIFFGTLCALDPQPAQLNNAKIIGLFALFADMISFHLQQIVVADQLEEQVQARTRELQAAVQDLERSNENLQQFAYVASHDLQEPLRKIQSFSNLVSQSLPSGTDASVERYLERITAAGARMSALIKDLLAYSRITTRQQAFGLVSLQAIVADVLLVLDWEIQQSGAQLEADELPIVQGDHTQLSQLFQNLLSNALKFVRPGQTPRIRIQYVLCPRSDLPPEAHPGSQVAAYHQIGVSDEGIGFDPKFVDRIFQVFQRLHGRQEYAGTGVGLAICQRVVENHGGALTADSQPGHGATFCVNLPA
jgi:signal transduction histidine kinase